MQEAQKEIQEHHQGIQQSLTLTTDTMKSAFIIALASIMLCIPSFAETTSAEKEVKKEKKNVQYNENGEIIKTGLNFGPLPVVAFDADRGFQYGALLNIYNFGDGKNYPNPNSTWYIEASAYTGGTWNLFLNYDNKEIFRNTGFLSAQNTQTRVL